MTYIGIDYGRFAGSNRDKATGIHYGVIAQASVGQAWYDDAQPDYGEPTCPVCSGMALHSTTTDCDDFEQFKRGCSDYACTACRLTFDSEYAFPDEALGWTYEAKGYVLDTCLETNIFVIASPYFTHAKFCSPCVPGAGDLDNADPEGVRTYCLGHEWFEDGVAPYPVHSVATGELVECQS